MPSLFWNSRGSSKTRSAADRVPPLRFVNNGNAHARPFGCVRVEDAAGRKAELVVSPFPILPGRTFDINLMGRSDPDPDR